MGRTEDQTTVAPGEAAKLGAVDSSFFSRYYFPDAFRQKPSKNHEVVWEKLERPYQRYVSIQMPRGWAKTTLLRCFTAKRITYGSSRTIVYIGKSQSHAIRSIQWLRNQLKKNKVWSGHFGMKLEKDTEEEIRIYHPLFDINITILALGIEGSVRGVNVEDHRPDLIILDDVLDEDNVTTHEQIQKVSDRILGAIRNSLAPSSEVPDAKLVMLQTPLDAEDASEMTMKDPTWDPVKLSCFDSEGNSTWPERYSTEDLRKEKDSYINLNKLSVWMREMEVTIMADESRYFRPSWLGQWITLPDKLIVAVGIDPSPPNEEEPEKRKRKDPDPEVVSAVAYDSEGTPYVLEQIEIDDPNPQRTWEATLYLRTKWKPIVVGVETTAYQRTLEWFFNQKMKETGIYFHLHTQDSKVKKTKRLRHTFTNLPGKLMLPMTGAEKFKDQYVDYPAVSYDDRLDSVGIGFTALDKFRTANGAVVMDPEDEEDIPELEDWRSAP